MMSEPSEKPKSFSTSIYVTDKASFQECKRLLELQGRSVSEEIMEFVLRRLAELKGAGSSIDSSRRLEELKAQHFQLSQKIDKFKSVLTEKKVFNDYRDNFAKVSGYNPGGAWDLKECVHALEKFLKHCSDDAWKKAETQFLASYMSGGLAHPFLDWLECVRERYKVERKLMELRTIPEELARLDELERQREEQRRKDAETRKQREMEEAEPKARQQRLRVDEEDELEEEDPEEDSENEDWSEEKDDVGNQMIMVPMETEDKSPEERARYNWIVFLPSKMHPNVGVLNRYYGVMENGNVKVRGLETRRRDTAPFVYDARAIEDSFTNLLYRQVDLAFREGS